MDRGVTDHGGEEEIDVNLVLRSVAHPRRRGILGLLDGEPELSRVAPVERLLDVQDTPGGPGAEEVETALVHTHLPKLGRAGLIVTDGDTWLIEGARAAGSSGTWPTPRRR